MFWLIETRGLKAGPGQPLFSRVGWYSERPTDPAPARWSARPTIPVGPAEALVEERAIAYGPRGAAPPRPTLPPSRPPAVEWLATAGAVLFGALLSVMAMHAWRARAPDPVAHASTTAGASLPTKAESGTPGAAELETAQPPQDAGPREPPESVQLEPIVLSAGPAPRKRGRAKVRTPPDRTEVQAAIEADLLGLHEMFPALRTDDVQRVVTAQRPRLAQCYSQALRRTGTAREAELRLIVHVAPMGRVAEAAVEGPEMGPLSNCLIGVARQWQFPTSREGAIVPVPLSFSPRPLEP